MWWIFLIVIGVVVFFTLIIWALVSLTTFSKNNPNYFSKSSINERKGRQGEQIVASILSELEGYTINGITFKDKNNRTHEIDHIFINKTGVYVIETKYWNGTIYGDDDVKNWTQVMGAGDITHFHPNPVKQNLGHVRCIKDILPKGTKIVPIVVLINNDMEHIESEHTIDYQSLKLFLTTNDDIFTPLQIKQFYEKLIANEDLEDTKEDHVNQIHEDQALIDQNICPWCKGKLVIKHGKYGDFYGCENFPKCKFRKNIK